MSQIDNFNQFGNSLENNIVLSRLSFDGKIIDKRVTSLHELEKEGNSKLTNQVLNLLTSGNSTSLLPSVDKLGTKFLYIIEVIQSLRSIIILGAGHVGRCLSIISSMLEFSVTLVDDREEFLTDSNISSYNIHRIVSPFDNYMDSISIGSNCAIVIVTRGHQSDEICLQIAIHTNARYIGMIGSKRRVLAIINKLKRSSLVKQQSNRLDNIYAPIGLEIGAKTPQEIAISILAQIIQVMNN